MKNLILVAAIALSSAACGLGEVTDVDNEMVATVTSVTNEKFSPGGAAVGYMLGGKNPLAWGIAGGYLAADGCQIGLLVGSAKVIMDSPDSYCEDMKNGMEVHVHRRVKTRSYPDQTKSFITYYRW